MNKKKIIIFGLVIVLLTTTAVTIIHFIDLNRLKPAIGQIVKNYTGRELTIQGDIRLLAHWPPTLAAEDVAFQNAPWGSQPQMIRVKRAAFAVSFTSLLRGEFRFLNIRLDEPEVLLEFNPEGESNFLLDIPATEGDGVIPVLAFNDILIQNGYFEYNDREHDLKASILVDDLEADIPGLKKPIRIRFDGNYRGLPLSLDGSIGPIMAWIQPGYTLPIDLDARLGGTTAKLEGDIRDPVQLKDISLDFSARGSSTREIADLIHLNTAPELGTFSIGAKLTDESGKLVMEKIAVHIGSPDLISFSATGRVGDLIAMKGFDLDLAVQTRHTGNLMLLADMPPRPIKAPFSASATFSNIDEYQYRLDNVLVSVGDEIIQGRMDIDLSQVHPVLDMQLQSKHTTLGPLALNTRLRSSLDRISVEHLEFQMGHKNLFKAFVSGAADNLAPIENLHLSFHISGKDLAHLQKITDQPLPVHGPYALSGALFMADRKAIQMPNLKIILDKSSISGSLRLDTAHDVPMLYGDLTSNRLNLERLLTPETLPDKLSKNLDSIGPSRLTFEMSGPIRHPALNSLEIQTRVENLASLNLQGSIKNLLAMTGTELHIAVKGSELANLKNFVGRDIPFNGPYAFSGRLRNTSGDTYHIEGVKITAAKNTFNGQSVIRLAKPNTRVSVQVSAENISLEALVEGQNPVLDRLRTQNDLGPLEIEVTTVFSHKDYRLQSLDLAFGKDDFVRTRVEGSIHSLTDLQDMRLDFQISGNNVSNLELIAGRAIPIKGPYALSGELSGQAPGNVMLRNLDLVLEGNRLEGQADLNMAGEFPIIKTKISADQFSLAPVTLEKAAPLKHIADLGPLKLAFTLSEKNGTPALTQLDIRLGKESALVAMLRGTVGNVNPIGDVSLDFEVHSQDLSNLNNAYGSRLIRGVPLQITGRLDGPQPNKITVTALEALYGDSDLSGTASLDFTGDRPSLVAHLSSRRLDLRPFIETQDRGGPPPQAPAPSKKPDKSVFTREVLDPRPFIETQDRGGPPSQAPALSEKPDKRVFSREHFDLTPLQQVTADVAFQGSEVLLRALALNNVDVHFQLREGDLNVDPLNFSIGGGTAQGTYVLQSSKVPPFMAANLTVDQFDISPMLQQLEKGDAFKGTLNTSIHLNSKGDSVAALMAGLNGTGHLNIHDGQIESKQLAFLERYMGSNVMELINPFNKRPNHTAINCLITTVDIQDGQADCKMVLDTEQSALVSTGTIDLKKEHLNLGIKPTPKKGFGEEHVGYISFSLKALSQPFGLGGTLARPQLVLDPGRTVITAGKAAGAWLLGPVGIALFFSDISLGRKNICEEALKTTGAE